MEFKVIFLNDFPKKKDFCFVSRIIYEDREAELKQMSHERKAGIMPCINCFALEHSSVGP